MFLIKSNRNINFNARFHADNKKKHLIAFHSATFKVLNYGFITLSEDRIFLFCYCLLFDVAAQVSGFKAGPHIGLRTPKELYY